MFLQSWFTNWKEAIMLFSKKINEVFIICWSPGFWEYFPQCLMLIQQRSNEKYGRETVCFWICSWYIPLYSSLACELRSITELQLRINQSRKRKHKKFFSSDACPLFRRKYKSVLNFVNFILSWKMHFVKKTLFYWWNDQNISRY